MKKYLVKLLALCGIFVLLLPITTAFAVSTSYNDNQQIYICDDADLLTPSEEAMLEDLAQNYVSTFDLNVLFLTTNDTNGKSTMVYSDDYMDDLFPKGVENNIAFVIDMDNREIYVNTMGIANRRLYDGEIEYALDRGYLYIVDGEYYSTMSAMADYCLDNIVNDKTTSTQNYGDSSEGIVSYMLWPGTLVGGIGTGILIVILMSNHNAANKTTAATKYMANDDYRVINKDEILIKTYDTVQRDYYKPKSSSSGGGGSSHRSSSGRSHGGGGRRF